MFRNLMVGALSLVSASFVCPRAADAAFEVTVFNSGQDLVIVGDEYPNNIIIEPVDATRVRIIGGQTGPFDIWPTFINGTQRSVTFTVRGSIFVDLGDHDDELTVRDVSLSGAGASINVLMGRGNDVVDIDSVFTAGSVNVDLGSGHDDLFLEFLVSSRLGINGRSGSDFINVYRSSPGQLSINAGSQDDEVWVYDNDMQSIAVNLETGDDLLGLFRSSVSSLRNSTLVGGSGRDRLYLPSYDFWNWNSFDANRIATGFE